MAALRKLEVTSHLTRQGNSTGLVLNRDVLLAAGLQRGDEVRVTVDRVEGSVTVRKADDVYTRALTAGRAFAGRYRHALAELAK
jgi:antitoxin component of MazEF toxin-antitoxin module